MHRPRLRRPERDVLRIFPIFSFARPDLLARGELTRDGSQQTRSVAVRNLVSPLLSLGGASAPPSGFLRGRCRAGTIAAWDRNAHDISIVILSEAYPRSG